MRVWLSARLPALSAVLLAAYGIAGGVPAVHAQADAGTVAGSSGFVVVDAGRRHDGRSDRVSLGHDTDLPAGQTADSVVSIGGSSSNEGEVRQDVVSVLGNTHATGPVGHNVVAVLGDTYVDAPAGGDVVAVMGSVHLGPHADVDGDVVAVGGAVYRDPMALVHGTVQQQVAISPRLHLGWVAPWVHHGFFYLRPLAWSLSLIWAWALALGFLVLYVVLALLFRSGIERCARTLEQHPGQTILTAVLAALLTPVLLLLLVITLIGIPAVPLVLLALLCATLFGKAAVLAWLGYRCLGATTHESEGRHPALAVLVGGLVVLVLYFVPVLGFVAFQLLGLLGFGVAIYTLLQASHERSGYRPAPPPVVPPITPPASAEAPTVTASPVASAGTAPIPTGAYAGFWVRMAALLIDALLIGIVVHLLPRSVRLELLLLAVYGAIMWKLRGTTIGGIVFNLQVARADGRPLDWTTAIVRALGCFLSLAIVGLGFFWIAFDDSKQAWHDKFAGTVVVRTLKAPSLV